MKEKIFKLSSIIIFILCIVIISSYLLSEFSNKIVIDIEQKIIILSIFSVMLYLSSVLYNISTHNKYKFKIVKITNFILFSVYLYLLILVTFFDSLLGRNISSITILNREEIISYIDYGFNIVPFKTIFSYITRLLNGNLNLSIFIKNIGGNLIMLMPFALFILILNDKIKLKSFIKTVFIVSICIEVLQFITQSGSCDIDDIILNVLGATIMIRILQTKKIKRLILYIFNQKFLKHSID